MTISDKMAGMCVAITHLVVVVCVWFAAPSPPPVESSWRYIRFVHKRYFQRSADITRRLKAISEELDRLGPHEWAGKYESYHFKDVQTFLYISPHGGAVLKKKVGFEMLLDGLNYGPVEEDQGRIRVTWTLPNDSARRCQAEFVLVRWGERRYLVPTREILDFFTRIRQGKEPRQVAEGWPLFRVGDEVRRVAGEPEIPADFERYRTLVKIDAKITAMGKIQAAPGSLPRFDGTRQMVRLVTFNVGRADGVTVGMRFKITKPAWRPDFGTYPIITQVFEHESEAMTTYIDHAQPDFGWEYSTPVF